MSASYAQSSLRRMRRLLPVALYLACATPVAANTTTPETADLVRAELLVEPATIKPAEPFWVGVRLTMKEHWHTYWRNPGDSGSPTEITWRLPPGFTAGEIEWPTPSVIRVGPATSFGYEGETVLLARITPPRELPRDIMLEADVSYLVCEKECIPGEATLSQAVTAADGGASPSGPNKTFEHARSKQPQPLPWSAQFSADTKAVTLSLNAADFRTDAIRSATFFPHANNLMVNGARQDFAARDGGARLTLERSQLASTLPPRVDGVLVIEEDISGSTARHAFMLSATPARASPQASSVSLSQALALALIAGVILNLMPCVFPVLSIKILHLTQHAGEPPSRVRMHGIAYTLGIAASFTVLAGALYAARAGGAEVGWGFQLQSPVVVALLAYILFALALSLSGILTVGAALTRVGGSKLLQRPGLSGSFFGGALATVVATPCTAPFMGASIGFALTQPFVTGLAVFLALGLGLALPFLLLSFIPGLQRLLPRPGAWMETLKQLLAFPLYATVAWLIWVLSFEVGPTGLLVALFGLVLIAFGAWTLSVSRARRGAVAHIWRGAAAAAAAGIVALAVMINSDRVVEAAPDAPQAAVADSGYEPFTQQKLDALLAADRPVFVNMTAAWCITCLVNERTALSKDGVRAAFEGKQIAYLKGDWTNRNPEITRLLQGFGRSGVPLYVLYRRGREPVVLPQILTESLVLDYVKEL
jgi:thiol:disulfide interchange protein